MYKLKTRVVEKLRIVYKNGYIHEMWVYNLKVDKDNQYSWHHYDPGNKAIDLQPDQICSIFVIKRKKVFYWIKQRPPRKKKIVIDQFKPKLPPLAERLMPKEEAVEKEVKTDKTGFWN